MRIKELSSKVAEARGARTTLAKQRKQLEEKLADLQARAEAIDIAQALVQDTARQTQNQLKVHIEDIVQLALDTCFPDKFDFLLSYEAKRGKTEANLRFLQEGQDIDLMTAAGGGVVDVAAFALRIAAWTLGNTDNVIVLDEPFRYLSRDLQPKAGEILQRLSKDLGLQFVMVTHQQEMIDIADRVFEVSQNSKGVSTVAVR